MAYCETNQTRLSEAARLEFKKTWSPGFQHDGGVQDLVRKASAATFGILARQTNSLFPRFAKGKMRLIFCSNPLARAEADPAYLPEFEAARASHFDCSLLNFEALLEDDGANRSVTRITPEDSEVPAIFRGWMMKPELYAKLYDAALDRGLRLINSPIEYRHCHQLPESFKLIRDHSPRSIWLKLSGPLDMETVLSSVSVFGSSPIVVKDYVKSRKHEWDDAFFIPAANDAEAVSRVVSNLVKRQGADLNEGLVFREFVEFEPIGHHPKSGLPLFNEYRLFFLNNDLLDLAEYWESGSYSGDHPPLDEFCKIARRVLSHFFTMDVAKTKSGKWLIIELGDGQVAGLPERLDIGAFYKKLGARLKRN
jgi:ATP-grasp domain, R2K clade family 3